MNDARDGVERNPAEPERDLRAFIEVHAALRDNGAFLASVEGDGYHPDADGYAEIAQVVLHNGWWEWLATPAGRQPERR